MNLRRESLLPVHLKGTSVECIRDCQDLFAHWLLSSELVSMSKASVRDAEVVSHPMGQWSVRSCTELHRAAPLALGCSNKALHMDFRASGAAKVNARTGIGIGSSKAVVSLLDQEIGASPTWLLSADHG